MSELNQILKRLEKLDAIEDKVTAIDTAVRGDSSRGLVGIAEHVTSIKTEFVAHAKHDAIEFDKINTTISRAKWWIGGVTAAMGVFLVGAELIAKFVKI